MPLTSYLVAVVLCVVCMYMLKACARDFRKTRGSETLRPYLFALGIVFSGGLLFATVVLVVLSIIKSSH